MDKYINMGSVSPFLFLALFASGRIVVKYVICKIRIEAPPAMRAEITESDSCIPTRSFHRQNRAILNN